MSDILRRNTAFARVWTLQAEPVLPAELADDLTARGFVPGVTEPAGESGAKVAAGLAEWRFTVGGDGFRFESLSSSRGDGAIVRVVTMDDDNPPPPLGQLRHYARRGKLVYLVDAMGPSNSDRNLCENLAEALLERCDGVVEIGGRGVKGNRPTVYTSHWLHTYGG